VPTTRHIGHLLVSINYVHADDRKHANSTSTTTKTCFYPIDLRSGSFVHPSSLYTYGTSTTITTTTSTTTGTSTSQYECLPESASAVVGAISLDTSALSQDASHYASRSNAARFLLVNTISYHIISYNIIYICIYMISQS
jgi:hypothetical protein